VLDRVVVVITLVLNHGHEAHRQRTRVGYSLSPKVIKVLAQESFQAVPLAVWYRDDGDAAWMHLDDTS
jgi:hypothetical protein